MKEVCILTRRSSDLQIKSMPITSATGPSSGTIINASSKKSKKKAKKKVSTLTTAKNPRSPPGRSSNKLSTQRSPLIPRKLKLKMVEPTKMNTTKHDRRVVLAMAWPNSLKLSRPRLNAMIMAPTAPIAPPSVGVATPITIVPTTHKIQNSEEHI